MWNATEKCASEALEVDEFYDLMMSVKSEIGVQIYKEVLNRTEELKQSLNMSSFAMQPWVTLDQQHSHKAANDLLKTVCNEYKVVGCLFRFTPLLAVLFRESKLTNVFQCRWTSTTKLWIRK